MVCRALGAAKLTNTTLPRVHERSRRNDRLLMLRRKPTGQCRTSDTCTKMDLSHVVWWPEVLKGAVSRRAHERNLRTLANVSKVHRDDFFPSQSWPSLFLSYCNCLTFKVVFLLFLLCYIFILSVFKYFSERCNRTISSGS